MDKKRGDTIDLDVVARRLDASDNVQGPNRSFIAPNPALFDAVSPLQRLEVYDRELDSLFRARGHEGMKNPNTTQVLESIRLASIGKGGDSIKLRKTIEKQQEGATTGPKSGNEAVQFFATADEHQDIKVLFLNRAPATLDYRPYDLVVVQRNEIRPEHFTISATGVVHICPGQPAQFISLAQWWRQSSMFSTLRSIPFFKHFAVAKSARLWLANVRFRKFCKVRQRIVRLLYKASVTLLPVLMELNKLVTELGAYKLMQLDKMNYTIEVFNTNQAAARSTASKASEALVDKAGHLLEKVCEDVLSRSRSFEQDEASKGKGGAAAAGDAGRKAKSKSMVQEKLEAAERARAYALAKREVLMLPNFIRLADYMMVEALMLLAVGTVEEFLSNLQIEKKKSFFQISFSMEYVGEGVAIILSPEKHEVLSLLDAFLDSIVSTQHSVQRILGINSLKKYLDERQKLTGLHCGDLIRSNDQWKSYALQIQEVVHKDFAEVKEYSRTFEVYFPIFEFAERYSHDDFANQDHLKAEKDIRKQMLQLRKWGEELEKRMKTNHHIGIFFLDSKNLRNGLQTSRERVLDDMKATMAMALRDSSNKVLQEYQSKIKALSKKPNSLKDYAGYIESRNTISEGNQKLTLAANTVDEIAKLLAQFDVKIPAQTKVLLDDLRAVNADFQNALDSAEQEVLGHRQTMTSALNQQLEKLDESLMAILGDLSGYNDDRADSNDVIQMLKEREAQIKEIQEEAEMYAHYGVLMSMPPHNTANLEAAVKLYDETFHLWDSLRLWEDLTADWESQVFSTLNMEDVEKEIQASLKEASRILNKKEDPVAKRFKDSTMKWKTYAPTLVALGNKAIKKRHFDRIFDALGRPYQADMTLSDLIDWEIFRYKDVVEEVSGVASGEYALEVQLEKIEKAWKDLSFVVKPYRESKDVFVLGGLDEVFAQLEDNQAGLQTMLASRFVSGIREQVETWDRRLALVSETLDEWLTVQRSWMYLESIFSAPDIQKQLPSETVQFLRVDQNFKETMRKTRKRPSVIDSCTGDRVLSMFQEANKILEKIQKSLEDYLETKRMGFPRFYFLSNDELLEILSQTRDPRAVQPHLRKCFDAMASADFEQGPPLEGETHPTTQLVAMNSAEKEKVKFSKPVATAPKSVEFWMCDLENMMRQSLLDFTIQARAAYNDDVREQWFFLYPAASISTVDQEVWTAQATAAIESIANGTNPNGLVDFQKYSIDQIAKMVGVIRTDLTNIQRSVMANLIVIDVHARDVTKRLISDNVKAINDFAWICQLRYYWDESSIEEQHGVVVKQTNANFFYGWEYLGVVPRLVITPLTDKCFVTLTGALNLLLGGAPAGPAGTGKTESVKDLGKALAMPVVVFNCSDGLDYKMMQKFFSGLAQAGAWACFDEFNRIDIEVLSVIAQQIMTIQNALKIGADKFDFFGKEIRLNTNYGCFITMNPGYAGRTELPDNLKALFRPMAMMVPDYALIAEIMLFSEGFGDSLTLARKQTAMYRLASEQLSSQDHYDFGMRAVKSVLVMAGKLKRADPNMVEDVTLIRALRDSNIPKFLAPDIPLFEAILRDLFPGVIVPAVDYGTVQKYIEAELVEQGLQIVPPFVVKVIQLHETMVVRHGIMLVGVTSVGKTTVSTTLGRAFTKMKTDNVGNFDKVDRFTLNPKSITMGELYGEFNQLTMEWTDGIISTIVREACNSVAEGDTAKKWICCDGPVDAIWIESMNTVLDDNKTLCLNNGERIKLPATMSMQFEVNDLAVASPATVSRCGMVYLEPVYLGWRPLARSWVQANMEPRFEGCGEKILELLDKTVDKTLSFVRGECKENIVSADINLVTSLFNLLDSLMRTEHGVAPDNLDLMLAQYFAFAYVWTLGGNLNDASLPKFDEFARELLVDVTSMPPEMTVYDWKVDVDTGSWVLWESIVPEFQYQRNAPFFSLIVPTVDTSRIKYLLQADIEAGFHVLVGGNSGVGKTVIIKDFLDTAGERFVSATKTFSAQTSARALLGFFEEKLEKLRKNLLGPPSGKTFIFFIDDLNMPMTEEYGAQPPIELLRQVINVKDDRNGGFYDLKKIGLFKKVQKTQFIAANAPPGGGRSVVTPRLMRHFHLLNIPDLASSTMQRIFYSILQGFLEIFPSELAALSRPIVDGTLTMYREIQKELRPTPSRSHYTFNLRDLAKVIQGVLMVQPKHVADSNALMRLWCHETSRVFRDRLITQQDRTWYDHKMVEVLENQFYKAWSPESFVDVCWGDFLQQDVSPYVEITNIELAGTKLREFADDYAMNLNKPMDLVFFKDAIHHVSRISRLLRQPRGNALLVGVGGSGRQSLTRLSAYIAEMKCFQIELTRGYGVNEFHEDLKRLLMMAGAENKPTVFLFTDTQVVKESFLEDINNILNAGEVPDLFAADEVSKIVEAVRSRAKAAGKLETKDGIYAHFVESCRDNLHCVLAFSPVGDSFRNRLRMFPSLVNCCTIDWFTEWPNDALISVARQFLSKIQLDSDELRNSVCAVCMVIHSSVSAISSRFLEELRRYNYTTPTSYLELINLYTTMLGRERDLVNKKVERYQGGCDKLVSTNAMVTTLQAEIIKLQPTLKKAGEETAVLIESVTKDKADAAVAQKTVEEETAKVNLASKEANLIKADAQKDLDEALPAFANAVKALESLNKKDITEMRSFTKPPDLVQTVMEAVCILRSVKPTWDEAKKLMTDGPTFLSDLMSFDKDNIPEKNIKALQKYIQNPDFTVDKVAKVSQAAKSLCMWVRAIDTYARVAKNVEPKKAALATAEKQVEEMQALLGSKQAEVERVLDRVRGLERKLEETLKQRDDLQRQSDECKARLGRAEQLMGGLGSEQVRWEEELLRLAQDKVNLNGNVLLSAGTIAYAGPFTADFRQNLVSQWLAACQKHSIPVDPEFTLERVLGQPAEIRKWFIQGLPGDGLSVENGLIVTLGRRWPLMIDPQTQANRWIRAKEKANKIQVIKLTEGTYLRTLENCIRGGSPVLLENVEEALDPALEPVLAKQVFKKQGRMLIRLGDTDVDYSPDFRFYITSKLANPHYPPEVCVKVTVVNFTVTRQGLEDQLLVQVVAHERPELDEEKNSLVLQIANGQKQLKDIEDRILHMLANSQGNILDDELLIQTLAASKTTSKDINDQLAQASETKSKIDAACEGYRGVARRGAVLYFVVADMGGVDPMYQYSLQFFVKLFNQSMDRTETNPDLVVRANDMIRVITEDVYTQVCRGLFEKDKKLFSFIIAVQILRVENKEISDQEWLFFLNKGGFVDDKNLPLNPGDDFIKPEALGSLMNLENLGGKFTGLLDSLALAVDQWRAWSQHDSPQEERLPLDWESKLSPFQRLLILRSLRDEKVVAGVTLFILKILGRHFYNVPPFDLAQSFKDSSPLTPIIFVLSTGADPTLYLYNLAREMNLLERLKMISLGQGQGPIADAMITSGRENGEWVYLQNCHLASSWMPELEKVLERHQSIRLHDEFRLWLSSMPSKVFPTSVLQIGIKLTNEPPKGLQANLKRTYEDITEQEFQCFDPVAPGQPPEGVAPPSNTPSGTIDGPLREKKMRAWKKLLFGLSFFHACIQERRKYGAIGWNIRYEWNQSDLLTAMANVRMYLEEQNEVPYETLRYVVGAINYGGRVTDYMDQRCVAAILATYFCPEAVEDDSYHYTDDGVYYAPPPAGLADVRGYVDGLPVLDRPEIFGLHRNAAMAFETSETRYLIDTIVSLQPRSGAGGGGKSSDEVVADIASDLAAKMPAALSDAEAAMITFQKDGAGAMNSMGTFLQIEMGKFNKLLHKMRISLVEVRRAISGTVVMSADLDAMCQALLFQRVPSSWASAYLSLKPLGSWFKDLLARVEFMERWISVGPPPVFWMSSFFFPQGFMTAALQTYARSTRLAIDTLEFRTEVQRTTPEEMAHGPSQGVYFYGAFMEGGRWDTGRGCVEESNLGETHVAMPVVWLDPIVKTDSFGKEVGFYNCPFYKVSSRAGTLSTTGHSTNYIRNLQLPCGSRSEEHWVRRSVALLTQLDD